MPLVGADLDFLEHQRVCEIGRPGYWEQHCDKALKEIGWQAMPDLVWRSCYWHPTHKAFLVVYVDDFKMAGDAKVMEKAWAEIMVKVKSAYSGLTNLKASLS